VSAVRRDLRRLVTLGAPCLAIAGLAAGAWLLGACRDDGHRCSTGEEYCPGADQCINTSNSPTNCGECGNACPGCYRCIMGQCTPACCAEEFDCNPSSAELECVVTTTDRANCGGCDVACADDEICRNGYCERCEPPATRCDNACAELSSAMQHCGECDHPCTGAAMYCECGECVTERTDASCPGPDGDADTDVDADADADHDADQADADHDADRDADPD
jgi:hypothetical protein